jgi:thioredoxin 1
VSKLQNTLVVHASTQSFEQEVLKASVPVFVDFWAPWCGPCLYVSPIIDQLAKQYEGKVKFVKVNTDENPDIAGSLGIQGIPTLIIFNGGKEVERVVGAAPKDHYVRHIERVLGGHGN